MAEDLDMFGIQIDIKLSKANINSALTQLQAYIDSKKLNVGLELSKDAIKGLELLTKQVEDTQKKFNKNGGLQVFNKEKLEKDGQEFIQYYTKNIDKLESYLKKMSKDIQEQSNLKMFKNAKGDVESFTADIQKTTGEIEKLRYSLAYIQNEEGARKNKGFILDSKSIVQGEIPTPALTKTAIGEASLSKDYELFQQRLKQITADLKANGAEISNIMEIVDTKTGLVTKATVQYKDSLGQAKTMRRFRKKSLFLSIYRGMNLSHFGHFRFHMQLYAVLLKVKLPTRPAGQQPHSAFQRLSDHRYPG
jgi:hypothetical protein